MKLGYDLTIKQTQKLALTPELIQAIQILQFSNQELESYVQEQLLINPVIETAGEKPAEEFELPDPERVTDSYRGEYRREEKQQYPYEQHAANDVTLVEHLMFQLQFAPLCEAQRKTGKYIIESLDDNGYLTQSRSELAESLDLQPEEIEKVLAVIHTFDPAGVGAENLSECLLVQLASQDRLTELKQRVISEFLEDMAANRLAAIAKKLGTDTDQIQRIADEIRTPDPKPGMAFASQDETRYITPDVFVEKEDGEYHVIINEGSVPRLMVSSYYRQVLRESANDRSLAEYLNDRINTANWLIKSIEQRKQTIYNVVSAVVRYQRDFFEYGPKHIKPMTLKQIAEDVGIHESTVSRSINGKYMQSPRGVFEIREFFTSGVSAGSGEGMSSKAVKSIIRDMVEKENPKKPCSDQYMADRMQEDGINISRRTVAKYREEMGIPSSQKRKRY